MKVGLKQELIGKELNGFQLIECIGEGGMALVFKAENCLDRRIVRAIKVIRPEYMEQDLFFQRFAREAHVLEQLQHPNIVGFHGIRKIRGLLIMELEYLQGNSLEDLILREEPLPLDRVLEWMYQIAHGLGEAHQRNIIHRDMKPANLFFTQEGVVKILDFGIAKVLDSIEEEKTGTLNGHVLGSPAYMAPEVCQGVAPTPRADVYALGLIFYHLIMGRHPLISAKMTQKTAMQMMLTHLHQSPPSFKEIEKEVGISLPSRLERVLLQATIKDVDERFATARHFAQALAPFLNPDQIPNNLTFTIQATHLNTPSEAILTDQHSSLFNRNSRRLKYLKNFLLLIGLFALVGSLSLFYPNAWSSLSQVAKQGVHSWFPPPSQDPIPIPKTNHPLDQIQWVEVKITPPSSKIQSLWVSKSEITVGQYYQCVHDKKCPLPQTQSSYGKCTWTLLTPFLSSPLSSLEQLESINPYILQRPMNCISYSEAETFAQWAEGRLPTSHEWRLIAKGGDASSTSLYPWGNQTPTCKVAVMYDQVPACGEKKQPYPVCSRSNGLSLDGLCDLAGNVWEWSQSPNQSPHALVLGGGWYSSADALKVSHSSQRLKTSKDSSVGFRLVRERKPQNEL